MSTWKITGCYSISDLRFDEPVGESKDTEATELVDLGVQIAILDTASIEILQVYSGPPIIVYKFRHWGYMEGEFKGQPPTGELVEMLGVSIMELDENFKVSKMEFFYDRGELLAGLIKGEVESISQDFITSGASSSCPFS
ncbi:hypothetical protein CTI12_AA210190 [Artemisia annua]|uniref:Uncharacterized protein n=1 Tax=Artemisia annua TaxID=35608 RepID=A0A2U1NZT1_ARTAN|nr:hypothetical protein CTI12_AA210190 [Artemisia annua]